MKCVHSYTEPNKEPDPRQRCNKEAEYVYNGFSWCKDHMEERAKHTWKLIKDFNHEE